MKRDFAIRRPPGYDWYMLHYMDAIYEDGVFRPILPVELAEKARVRLIVQDAPADADEAEIAALQRKAMEELDAELEHIPDGSPDDGFTAADHDRVLYGRPA